MLCKAVRICLNRTNLFVIVFIVGFPVLIFWTVRWRKKAHATFLHRPFGRPVVSFTLLLGWMARFFEQGGFQVETYCPATPTDGYFSLPADFKISDISTLESTDEAIGILNSAGTEIACKSTNETNGSNAGPALDRESFGGR